ncbi:MAG: LPS export ABC transporter ATP-binding protein [Candidatus Neomarinimicrobiota bacterium]
MRQRHNTLRAEGLEKIYGKRLVVKGVDFSVDRGEVVGLLGPNGAGKTTSFYMITGMIKPNNGHVFLDNLDITNDPMYKRARKGIGYLAQEPSIFGKLTVAENLELVLQMRNDLSVKDQKKKARDLLEDFSVFHLSKSKGNALSGGERRRVEMARSLCMDPDFILLDEPFAGVDPIAVEEIQEIVHSLKKKDIGVLITDHNVRETLSITDRSYLLFDGEILKSGTSEYLARDEEAKRLYLGENFKLD